MHYLISWSHQSHIQRLYYLHSWSLDVVRGGAASGGVCCGHQESHSGSAERPTGSDASCAQPDHPLETFGRGLQSPRSRGTSSAHLRSFSLQYPAGVQVMSRDSPANFNSKFFAYRPVFRP